MLSRSKQKLLLLATQIVCEGSAFARNLILARLLGAEEMGLAIALALGIRLVEMAGEFGLDRLLVHVEVETLSAMRDMVHLIQLIKGVLLAIALMLLATPVARTLNPALDPALFALAALALVIRGASNLDFRERQRQGDFVPALKVEGGSAFISVLVCIPLAWLSRDYSALVWLFLIQAGAYCMLSHAVACTAYRPAFEQQLVSRCLRYGAPIALNGALMFLALQGDRVVVALIFSAAELASFALAAQLTLLPALIGARYLLAAELPRFARLTQEPVKAGNHCIALLLRVSCISLAGVVMLGISGNTLVAWLYGEGFTLEPAVFWLLAVTAGLRFIRGVPGAMLIALERTHFLLISNLPRLVTLPVAFWLATNEGNLFSVVAIGAIGEALSLLVALAAVTVSNTGLAVSRAGQLAEGV